MAFSGFPKQCFEFLARLEKKNDKRTFDAHRADYDSYVVAPSKEFVEALGDELKREISKKIVAIPSAANGSMGRINRDIRFSKDKRPYNSHLMFTFWEGKSKKEAPGFVVWLSPSGIGLGAGVRGLDGARLAKYQKAVAADRTGKALVSALAAAKKAKASLGEPDWKRVPKAFDPDHPRGELLRYAGLHVVTKAALPKVVHGPKLVGWCSERLQALAPVERWLVANT